MDTVKTSTNDPTLLKAIETIDALIDNEDYNGHGEAWKVIQNRLGTLIVENDRLTDQIRQEVHARISNERREEEKADMLKTGWSEFKAIDYIETEEDLEAYVKARIEASRDTRHILCRYGFHLWRWLPENKERCTRAGCGCIREDLP